MNPRLTTDDPDGSASAMRVWRWSVCAWLVVVLAGTPPATTSAQTVLLPEQTLARVVLASPDAPPIDIYIDDRLLVGAAVSGSVTDYLPVETGERKIQVVPAGGDLLRQALVSVDIQFDPDVFHLLTIQNYLNGITVTAYPLDGSTFGSQGYARLRLIHLVPDANGLSLLTSDGDDVFNSILPLTASRYTDIQAGGHAVSIRPERQEIVPPITTELTLLPNVDYDLVVTGELRDESVSVQLLATPTRQPCGQFLAIGGTESGCLRFVNASPDIPTVDLYVGEERILVATGLAFGVVSPVISIPTGDVEVRIVPAGGAPDDDFASTSLFTEDGDGFLLIGSGRADRAVLENYEDLQQPLGGRQARLTLIHQANGAGTLDISANGSPVVRAMLESEESAARLVPAGAYVFEATGSQTGQRVAIAPATRLEAGSSYQIVVAGDVDEVVAIVVAGLPVPSSASIAGR